MSKWKAYLAIGIMGLLWSCYPKGPEYVEEYDLTLTSYDATFDFKSRGTYSLPDRVVKVDGDPNSNDYIGDIYGIPILKAIDDNMKANGWTKVAVNANPDIEVLPAAWSTTNIISGGYWGNYWCWYNPYYCAGGGWWYPYPSYSSYTTGTLIITITDPKSISIDGSKKLAWTATMNGLLGYTSDINRVTTAIGQSFSQSPYLKIK